MSQKEFLSILPFVCLFCDTTNNIKDFPNFATSFNLNSLRGLQNLEI